MSNEDLKNELRTHVCSLTELIHQVERHRDALTAARDNLLWRARSVEGVTLVELRKDSGLSKRGLEIAIARGRESAGGSADLS